MKKRIDHADERKSLAFAWYLNIWLNVLHRQESEFWKMMNPCRCIVLYDEYYKMIHPAPPEPKKRSLAEYLAGGGA